MNKKILFILLLPLLLTSCKGKNVILDVNYSENGYEFKDIQEDKVTISYYYNFNKQEFNLNSGLYATGNSLALKVDILDKGSSAIKPDIDPVRKNYEFDGWHKNPTESSPWNFETDKVEVNTVLYAHWRQKEAEIFVEPEYVAPSNVDSSIANLVDVKGVLNFSISNGTVKVSKNAIDRLAANKNDVSMCLNYLKKYEGVSLTATYNEQTKVISYQATYNSSNNAGSINVLDNSSNLVVNNTTYENKAKNYENLYAEDTTSIEDHHIMLAGSSSMENWSTSTEDLLPLTSYNHGIGGTTVEQWKDKLNARLVYPFSPKIIVYYVGVNNLINSHDSADVTSSYLTAMFDDVHAHLPNTKIYYVLINALPGYMSYLSQINTVNQNAINYERNHDYLTTLDAGSLLLKQNGEPNSAFFLTDGLHMSKYGYVLWGGYIKNKLIEDMSDND